MDRNTSERVLLCIDNVAGYEVLKYLAGRPGVEVVAAIVHPEANATHLDEIVAFCAAVDVPVIEIRQARKHFDKLIAPLKPDFLVSIFFDYILDDRFVSLPSRDAVNLHPGYLPYNKGFYYYAWAVLDGTPAGVSIHRIVSEVDAGPIISQLHVRIDAADTGEIIYDKHMNASIELFKASWPALKAGTYKVFRQRHGGTRKLIAETNKTLEIDPHASYTARDLIDKLRVFSFSDGGGCVIQIDGRKYSVGIELVEIVDEVVRIPGKRDNCVVV
ncbi:MAG: formyl transferase [Pseudomonadota bacterium]|nr:formyl transferase [Pseudomonadota bacterium]